MPQRTLRELRQARELRDAEIRQLVATALHRGARTEDIADARKSAARPSGADTPMSSDETTSRAGEGRNCRAIVSVTEARGAYRPSSARLIPSLTGWSGGGGAGRR
jgi:hypothetical protein